MKDSNFHVKFKKLRYIDFQLTSWCGWGGGDASDISLANVFWISIYLFGKLIKLSMKIIMFETLSDASSCLCNGFSIRRSVGPSLTCWKTWNHGKRSFLTVNSSIWVHFFPMEETWYRHSVHGACMPEWLKIWLIKIIRSRLVALHH